MTFSDLLYLLPVCLISLVAIALFWLVTTYFLFRSVDRNLRRCPKCKRAAAGTIVESEINPLPMQIDRNGLTLIRYKREKVTDHYQCNRCDHTWTRSFERKEHAPVKSVPPS